MEMDINEDMGHDNDVNRQGDDNQGEDEVSYKDYCHLLLNLNAM